MNKNNISIKNMIKSHLTSFKIYKINPIIFYCEVIFINFFIFKNYYSILLQIKKKQFPINFIFRNGESINASDLRETALLLTRCKGIKFQKDRIVINNDTYDDSIILENWKHSVSVKEIFIENEYGSLDVKNKIVLDIGANVGDTSILFSRLGAKKVIGLEPQVKFFNMCKKNIEINNLGKKIDIFNAGLDDTHGFFTIDEHEDSKGFDFKNAKKGIKIPKKTLEDIMPDDGDLILKLDCELCEYNVILNTDKQCLQKFETIIMEFHDGNENLIKKLSSIGFEVRILNSRWTFKKKYRGHLIANNKNI